MSRTLMTIRSIAAALVIVGALFASAGAAAQAIKGGNPKAAAVKNPVKPTPDSIRKGRQGYMKSCRHCHGASGVGDGPLAPKNPSPANLTDADWKFGSTDGEIYWVIANGVGGDSEMKGVRSEMTATDMWNIVNYLRTIGPTP